MRESLFFIGFLNNVIYLFLAVLSLHCCVCFSLVVESGSCSLVVVHGLFSLNINLFTLIGG